MAPEGARARVEASPAARRCVFESGPVRVAVRCPSADDLRWLEEFLAPTFRPRPPGSAVDYTVEAVVDGDLYRRLLATRPAGGLPEAVTFVLDQSVMRAPWWGLTTAGQRVLADSAHEALYGVSGAAPRVRVVAPAGGRLFRGAVMRIAREIAMARAWGPAGVALHAAAFSIGGRGVVVAGPKRSGKTSLLVHCLSASGAAYVSNDRVLVSLAGPVPVAQGMPAIVSLRHGTLALFPELARTIVCRGYRAHLSIAECQAESVAPSGPSADGDARVSPAQLCRLLGVPMVAEASVTALLLPRVDAGSLGIGWRRLPADEAASRFETVVFAAGSDVRVSEVFRAGQGPASDLAGARVLWDRLVSRVPTFDCRFGPSAFDERPESGVLRAIRDALDASGPS
jgi:hypothetical protein